MKTYGDGWCAMGDHPAGLDRLMCAQHWRIVPRPLQQRVNRAYAEWLRGEATLEELRGAQDAAVHAVEGFQS